jgi:uncharacterized protein (TIGR02453 family)
MLDPATLRFLKQLKKHNDKSWLDAHRKEYDLAKATFSQFIGQVLEAHAVKDDALRTLKVKDCLFRINRDIRFSKDKSPYKTNFGASMNKGGKKSIFGGYYFHCEPGGQSFVGGGLWMPMPGDLKKVRQEIDYCWDEFRKIVGSKSFTTQYGDLSREDYSLIKVPKGYEKDNPAADYLKLKCFVAMRPLSDAELSDKALLKTTLKAFESLQPLLNFINRTLTQEGS